tara:strand:- start:31 stop:888 length:858 start_codon:yes stop_codon:yes gene_type:complete
MPIPTPNDKEKRSDFMSRCVADLSEKGEFGDNKQRVAVCISQFEKASKKASVAVGNEFLDGKGPWDDQDLFFLYNTPQIKMSEASYHDNEKSKSKHHKMDEKETKIFKSYMSHCVMNDADMVDTKEMNMDNTMKACGVQYNKDRPILMENTNGQLTEKQKKLPPALQEVILKKMKEEGKANHHYGDKEESKAAHHEKKKMKGGMHKDEKTKAGMHEKKKMEAADDPMAHSYPTAKEAMKDAKKLGLQGIHMHKGKDGKPVYMPGKSHDEFMKRHKEIMKEKKKAK